MKVVGIRGECKSHKTKPRMKQKNVLNLLYKEIFLHDKILINPTYLKQPLGKKKYMNDKDSSPQ